MALQPIEALAERLPWALDMSPVWVRFIGISKMAGAIGIFLPAVTRILPWLTPLAGIGLATVMILACGFHAMRSEYPMIIAPLILGLLAVSVAYGRWKLAPIQQREVEP